MLDVMSRRFDTIGSHWPNRTNNHGVVAGGILTFAPTTKVPRSAHATHKSKEWMAGRPTTEQLTTGTTDGPRSFSADGVSRRGSWCAPLVRAGRRQPSAILMPPAWCMLIDWCRTFSLPPRALYIIMMYRDGRNSCFIRDRIVLRNSGIAALGEQKVKLSKVQV